MNHPTNLSPLTNFPRDSIKKAAINAAQYAVTPGAYRLANGQFARPENAVAAFSIAVNTGIVFC